MRKDNLLRFWSFLSLLNWIGAPILSLLPKLPQRKFELDFLSREFVRYYKSTIWTLDGILLSCVWAGAPSCYLEMLDNLQKQICRTAWPSLTAPLKPLAHCWNVASLSVFCRYYFGRPSSELAQLVPLPYYWGTCTHYSDRLHDFTVTFPRCYKDVYVNRFFPWKARL